MNHDDPSSLILDGTRSSDARADDEQEPVSDGAAGNDDASILNEGNDADGNAGGDKEPVMGAEAESDDNDDDVSVDSNVTPEFQTQQLLDLRRNTIKHLRVNVEDPTSYNDLRLTRALQSNVSVTELTFVLGVIPQALAHDPSLLDRPENANLKSYLTAALSLPNLKTITLFPGQHHIASLSFALQHAAGLQELLLWLGGAGFAGTTLEFQQFAVSLLGMQSLETLKLWHNSESVVAPEIQEQLSPIINVIPLLPHLKMLELNQFRMDAADLGRVIRNPSLRCISYEGVPLDKEQASAMVQSLRVAGPNSQLEAISLRNFSFTPEVTDAISSLITANLSFPVLVLGVNKLTGGNPSHFVEFFEAVTQALRSSSTLMGFRMFTGTRRSDPRIEVSNTSLTQFNEMLADNTSLTRVALEGFVDETGARRSNFAEADLYVKLNRMGRGMLLGNGSETPEKAKWIEILGDCSDDLDCLFYFLSANPSLCQDESWTDQNSSKKRKRDN